MNIPDEVRAELKAQERIKKRQEERIKAELEILDKIPDWIERGNKIIYPQSKYDWAHFIRNSLDINIFSMATTVENALRIMEALDQGASCQDAIWKTEYGLDKRTMNDIKGLASNFSKRGPEFGKFAVMQDKGSLSREDEIYFNDIAERNAKYEAESKRLDAIEREE